MDHLPQDLCAQYDVSVVYGGKYRPLKGVALEPRGVVVDSKRSISLILCDECYSSLRSRTQKPPWKSVANGFALGHLPKKFDDLSYAERRMATISPLAFSLLSVWGRYGGILSSHMVARLSSEGCAHQKVPWTMSDTEIIVAFANATISDRGLARKKFYRVRRDICLDYVDFLVNNSFAYSDTDVNIHGQHNLPVDGNAPHTADDNNDENAQTLSDAISDSSRVTSGQHSLHSVVAITERPNTPTSRNISNVDPDFASLRRFLVSDASSFANMKNPKFFGQTFPQHFPYGYGTPNDVRPVKVSIERCFKHYLLLGDRSIAEDFVMVFFMYDALSQRKLHMSLHLHIKLNPGCALTALSISTADIQSLISNTAAYNFALRRGVTVTDSSTNQSNTDAQSAMRIVQKAASNAFGTDDERMKMRKRIDAFCDRFGKPHIHATITPIDADSGWIAINTSKFSSDDTLPDIMKNWDHDAFLSSDDIRTATRLDPALAAYQFELIMNDIVIPQIFGWDMKSSKATESGGDFGVLDGFISCYEAQGAATCTCHSHSLLWVKENPKTAAEAEAVDPSFNRKMETLANNTCITTFPILELWTLTDLNTLQSPCCITGKIDATPIPFIAKTDAAKYAPIVGTCSQCKKTYTSSALRDEYLQISLEAVGHAMTSTWKQDFKKRTKKIISSLSHFPMPDPSPINLPIRRKQQIRFECIRVMQSRALSIAFVPDTSFADGEYSYVYEISQLTIAIEDKCEHSHVVNCYMFLLL